MELIFLHGTAAAGKLTTARALETLLGYPVFHNHLVVDALTAVFPFGSEPFVRLREEFWLQVFTDAARTTRSLTFTFAPEATVQLGFPARARTRVETAGGRVCFVRLLVTESEQERRIGNPGPQAVPQADRPRHASPTPQRPRRRRTAARRSRDQHRHHHR